MSGLKTERFGKKSFPLGLSSSLIAIIVLIITITVDVYGVFQSPLPHLKTIYVISFSLTIVGVCLGIGGLIKKENWLALIGVIFNIIVGLLSFPNGISVINILR